MKKVILATLVLASSLSFADNRMGDRRDDRREDPRDRLLRECMFQKDELRRDNQSLQDRLFNCQSDTRDRETINQLVRENQDLKDRNNFLLNQNAQLKMDIARLEMEAHPERGGGFNLAASIQACGKIDNASYAQQCTSFAKQYSIQAESILQCARITNTYYALTCVQSAGQKGANSRQIEACLKIDNAAYAQQCVDIAGAKKIRPDVITSCISTSSNTYYQLQCVNNM